jgi:hypothetical protein
MGFLLESMVGFYAICQVVTMVAGATAVRPQGLMEMSGLLFKTAVLRYHLAHYNRYDSVS